ncbi:hypothetical protein EDC04DRAFT_2608443 [Pisolithus marmoratus]|nr:hypothetical protein EDC04DRAFT_2608443 [Pisolithus marmoratus]
MQWTANCESVTVCVSTERSSDEVVEALEISIHDFKLEFPTGASIQVILDVPAIFLVSHISLTTYISREPDNQVLDDPLICESRLQPGDFIHVISGPHKGLCGTLHWHSSHKILITLSTLQQADPDNLGDKGKSRAQEPKVLGSNGDIDEGSDLIQVSVSMDEVLIIPPSTLQFSREKGYDVTIGDCVRVARGPAVGIEGLVHSVDFVSGHLTVLADDGPLVGREVWIISGPRKGYRGMLRSVGRTYCNVMIESGIMQLKNTAIWHVPQWGHLGFYTNGSIHRTVPGSHLFGLYLTALLHPCHSRLWILQPESGPSTLACDPWVPHSDDTTPQPLNELAQADADYGCVPWLFDNNFCDYANWHVCLRVAMSYNCGSLLNRTWAWLSTSWSCVSHCDLKYTRDLTPTEPEEVLVSIVLYYMASLLAKFTRVKKCQVKKDPKGVELEDSTKLPLGDVWCGDYWAGIGALVPPHCMITSECMETDF